MPELESPCTCRWPWRMQAGAAGPSVRCRTSRSDPSGLGNPGRLLGLLVHAFPGSRLFWSRTYNKTKAGTIRSTARTVATSTAVIVPVGAAASRHRQRFGQEVVPLGNSPPEDERSRRNDRCHSAPLMRPAPKQHKRAKPC